MNSTPGTTSFSTPLRLSRLSRAPQRLLPLGVLCAVGSLLSSCGNETDSLYVGQFPATSDSQGTDGTADPTDRSAETPKSPTCDGSEWAGSLDLSGNPQAASKILALAAGAKRIDGDLILTGELEDLSALDCLEEVGGTLVLAGVNAVAELSLPRLEKLGGDLEIANASALRSVSLPALTAIGDQGSILVTTSELLTRFELPALKEIAGDLRMSDLGQAASEPFQLKIDGLTAIGGDLLLLGVANLESLNGLAASLTVASRIAIVGNAALTSIDGLQEAPDCAVLDNPQLTTCAAEGLACAEVVVEGNLAVSCGD